ncbi:MAG: hypothetical protein U0176_05005 [Bacteroidia bacterium]
MKKINPLPWSFLLLFLLIQLAACKKEAIVPVYGVNDGSDMAQLIAEISRKAKQSDPDFW